MSKCRGCKGGLSAIAWFRQLGRYSNRACMLGSQNNEAEQFLVGRRLRRYRPSPRSKRQRTHKATVRERVSNHDPDEGMGVMGLLKTPPLEGKKYQLTMRQSQRSHAAESVRRGGRVSALYPGSTLLPKRTRALGQVSPAPDVLYGIHSRSRGIVSWCDRRRYEQPLPPVDEGPEQRAAPTTTRFFVRRGTTSDVPAGGDSGRLHHFIRHIPGG